MVLIMVIMVPKAGAAGAGQAEGADTQFSLHGAQNIS